MRSGQAGYRLATHGGRVPIQGLVGAGGWGMFLHQPLGTFDFTGEVGRFVPSGDLLPLNVFMVSSASPAEIMREYARITGFAEMPPLWALGYMQSHRTLAGPEEVLSVARTLRERKLPCDGLIYLGTEFTPSGWNTRNGEFTWHSSASGPAMIDAFLTLQVVPHISSRTSPDRRGGGAMRSEECRSQRPHRGQPLA
jgi:alpha-glucosidase/alpha-D-xyloside xylohydrolase